MNQCNYTSQLATLTHVHLIYAAAWRAACTSDCPADFISMQIWQCALAHVGPRANGSGGVVRLPAECGAVSSGSAGEWKWTPPAAQPNRGTLLHASYQQWEMATHTQCWRTSDSFHCALHSNTLRILLVWCAERTIGIICYPISMSKIPESGT